MSAAPVRNRQRKRCDVPDPDKCSAAEESAIKVISLLFGVDANDPRQVEDLRRDIRFGGELRRMAGHGKLAVIAALATAFGAAVWVSITQTFGGGK